MDELSQIIREWEEGTISLDTVIDEINEMQMLPPYLRALLIEDMLEIEPTDIILH